MTFTYSPAVIVVMSWQVTFFTMAHVFFIKARMRKTIEIMYQHGATHFQIGKAYRYVRERNAAIMAVLRDVKRRVDPKDRINPGALQLLHGGQYDE